MAQTKNKTELKGVETVIVKLPRIKNAEDPVFVSVNDYTCYIKRGESVEVPAFVAEVLEHQDQMLDVISSTEDENKYEG